MTRLPMQWRSLLAVGVSTWVLPPAAAAQQAADSAATGLQATRAALESLAQSTSGPIRMRLTEGDFQQGDRILLSVEGEPQLPDRPVPAQPPRTIERQLSDTFTVGADREVVLPVIGPIALRGVLRAELESYLTREIARFVNDPVVHAKALIRVSIAGAVTKPGFYFVPTDAALADALTVAGGPTQDAKLGKIRIERAGKRLYQGDDVRHALTEGRTLDAMHIEAGDLVFVPGVPGHAYDNVRLWATLLSIPVAIYALAHAF